MGRSGAAQKEAVLALKNTLIKRFGSSAQDVIEAEVEGRLGGRGGRLSREDIDAIEAAALAAQRQRRGAPAGTRRCTSTPTLLVGAGPSGSSASSTAKASTFPPAPPPARRTPPTPSLIRPPSSAAASSCRGMAIRTGGSALAASASTGSLPARRPPPYGLTIEGDDNESVRSRVKVNPKFPVPIRPKLKPMDHWDLMVAYDAEQYRQEQETLAVRGHRENCDRFRAVLDGQMNELRDVKAEAAELKRKEREEMSAQILENKRLEEQEQAILRERRDKMKLVNDEMTEALNKRDQKIKELRQKEQDNVLSWLAAEKERSEREEQERREEYARKCKKAREEREAAHAEAERRREQRKKDEITYVQEQQANMDAAVAAGRAAVQERMDEIDRNCRTLGAEIQARDAEAERKLQENIRRVQEEGDRRSKEDAARRQAERDAKTKDMMRVRAMQVKEFGERGNDDKEACEKQAKVWAKQLEEGLEKDRKEAERRRQARAELDEALMVQINEQIRVHPLEFGMTDKTRAQEVSMNKAIFEQMVVDGFRTSETMKLSRAEDRGRLELMASVPRPNVDADSTAS